MNTMKVITSMTTAALVLMVLFLFTRLFGLHNLYIYNAVAELFIILSLITAGLMTKKLVDVNE